MKNDLSKEELEERVRDLKREVAENQKSLAAYKKMEDRMRQAQKMEAIGTLARGVAHDFNNILGIILGNTEMALSDLPEWDSAHVWLAEIKTATLRAQGIVKRMLTFSKNLEDRIVPIHIGQAVRESMKLLGAMIPASIEIEVNLDADRDIVMADPVQIHQIMINVCTNAYHSMRETGGKLTVRLNAVPLDPDQCAKYNVTEPGTYARLVIKDTGHGMDQEVVDRIFEPGFTTRDFSLGNGLGLSVVSGIVKNLGGGISVKSAPANGATFEIVLPVVDTAINASEIETPGSGEKGSERILFVDDEIALVRLGKQMLQHYGYTVTTSINPVKALEQFREEPDRFDLVITDLTMPNMSGSQLVAEMIKIRPDIPVIVCSGHSDLIDSDITDQQGIKAFLAKPIRMIDLNNKVREVLDG